MTEAYESKRDFRRTPEPKDGKRRSGKKPVFVIQKHDASTLHYDVRLEVDGVLKSWAVPKGPSTDPREKRLAIPTEDHPLDYADFEGVIPEDEYGGGTVLIWDRGTYRNITEKDQGLMPVETALDQGHLLVRLDGHKLKGGYAFQRTDEGRHEKWLLIKMDDDEADARRNPVSTEPKSVVLPAQADRPQPKTPVVMDDLFSILTSAERDKLEENSMPKTPAPMLATLTDKRFSDPGWIYERKLDGERAVAQRSGAQLRLLTRNGKDIASTYPELVDALGKEDRQEFAVDGEIVAFDGKVTSFARLQQRMQTSDPDAARASGIEVFFYLFDITYLDGQKLDKLPLRSRKKLLKHAFSFASPLRLLPHRNESGEALFEAACKKGWEGIIAKRADAPYRHSRSRDWLKFKCVKGQELVIGGFSEPKGSRAGFGALLVGYYDDDGLRYAGKVGTGYDEETLTSLRRRMDRLARKTSPFVDDVRETDTTWISPKLVGAFGFTEWTRSGKLRHPRFLGLRRDKAAKDVVRERPVN